MIPDFFVQTELNLTPKESKTVKGLLAASYAVKVLSTGFIVLAAVFNMWLMLGFAGVYAIGIALRQGVLGRVEAFEYFLIKDKLKISVRNNFHVQKVVAEIFMGDIVSLEAVSELPHENDGIIAAPDNKSIIKMRFIENNTTKNLYFAPSEYMQALIRKRRNI